MTVRASGYANDPTETTVNRAGLSRPLQLVHFMVDRPSCLPSLVADAEVTFVSIVRRQACHSPPSPIGRIVLACRKGHRRVRAGCFWGLRRRTRRLPARHRNVAYWRAQWARFLSMPTSASVGFSSTRTLLPTPLAPPVHTDSLGLCLHQLAYAAFGAEANLRSIQLKLLVLGDAAGSAPSS